MESKGIGTSTIELLPYGQAKLSSVAIEDDISDDEANPKHEWIIYSGDARWDFEEIPHKTGGYSWTVRVFPTGHSSMDLAVRLEGKERRVLLYRSNPEFKVATVYLQKKM